ncbi:ABC-type antimicrobial peptide transport system, permease component [Ekhidna lutea]|uniref:ABC-type antimicrobial peptide transport system, permease component n=1 Tax=Ekhidna lutea TaxID=447679 RepID=A0A239LHD7_EKHLU|nr:ABC transporter permease [Ekhidna lutea]SNT29332.1 ABC-type antimicrobial peptide transport system, permease component [Ekhidna lutea]
MLKNYLKTALRNLSRNKVYSILNVLGLALGIGCALVIYKVIVFENSFDKHQENFEKIYRIVHQSIRAGEVEKGMGTPHPVGPSVKQDFPEVEHVARTHYDWGNQINVKDGTDIKKFLLEEGVVYTENSFFNIFTVEFLAGDPETVLTEPNTAVISASESRKLFGKSEGEEAEVMGETFNVGNLQDFKIVGVIADPPEATNFKFTILLEYTSQKAMNPYFNEGNSWNSTSSNTNTYFLAGTGFHRDAFDNKMLDFVEKNYEKGASERRRFVSQPLSEIHFDDEYGNYVYSTSPALIKALAVIAIFLVLTACINFINLATAQAASRSKEIGIRKAIGGYSRQLVIQFFTEITLITLVALFCSLAIAEFLFVQLEDVIRTRLTLDLFVGFETIGFLVVLLVLVSFLSGFYPSILLSGMNTVKALKSKISAKEHSGGLNLRKALVVAQFTISQFLIIGTVIISAQMRYFMEKDLGFEKEAIIKSYLPERDEVKNARFKSLMLENPAIENITFSLSSPTGNSNSHSNFNYPPLNVEDDFNASFKTCDEEYMKLYGLELLAGRNIRKNDSSNYVVVNQKIADLMGFKDNYAGALGERLTSGWRGYNLKVIGVMKDFHTQDLSEGFQYVLLLRDPDVYYEVAFKTREGANVKTAITQFEDSWEKVYPEFVMDWQFYDEELAENYEQEQSVATLMTTFSAVSIIIGCLGLYGLIAFISANRTKEVGIRKVLGASILSIIGKFTKEVFVLVIVAFLIAAPAAYYILNQWLNDYQFRIDIGIGFFAVAFIVTLLIAALTVSHRTISTALINPATTLKDE